MLLSQAYSDELEKEVIWRGACHMLQKFATRDKQSPKMRKACPTKGLMKQANAVCF